MPSAYRQALRQFGLVVLHAMEVFSHLQDSTLIDFMVTSSLLATQAPERIETAKTWFGKWVNFYRRIELEKPELRHIAMQIGLPLRAVRKLYGRLMSDPEILALFSLSEENPLILSEEQMKTATQMVADIEELDWIPSTAPHVGLMQSWLRGRKIETLTSMLGPHLNQQKRFVEQTCNYTTQKLSNAAAWGMYALRRMLELILGEENISPIVKRLPLLMYFGVDTTPAAIFALMGIERIDAIRLGNAFLESGEREASIHLLKTWASIIDLEELKKILRGNDERELDYETINILRTA